MITRQEDEILINTPPDRDCGVASRLTSRSLAVQLAFRAVCGEKTTDLTQFYH